MHIDLSFKIVHGTGTALPTRGVLQALTVAATHSVGSRRRLRSINEQSPQGCDMF